MVEYANDMRGHNVDMFPVNPSRDWILIPPPTNSRTKPITRHVSKEISTANNKKLGRGGRGETMGRSMCDDRERDCYQNTVRLANAH